MAGGLRRAALAAAVVPCAGLGLLWTEARVARRGTHLTDPASPPADALVGPPGPAGPLVVWLGDSTAAGTGASGLAGTLPRQVANRLGGPMRLTVVARSGARIADVLRNQLPVLAHLAPDAIYVSVGTNDAIHFARRRRFRRDYDRLLAELPTTVHQVVLLGVPDLGAPTRIPQPLRALAGWRGRAFDSDVRHLAVRHRALYVDIAGRAGPPFRRQPNRYFAADHYHPDDAGYGIWAGAVAATVVPRS